MRIERIGDAVLYLGDCRDILPTLPKVDAVCTDPPYGIGESNKKNLSRGTMAAPIDYGDFEWDQEPITDELLQAVRDKAKWQIIFGGNYYALPPSPCWLIWDKLNGDSDFADCEMAWTNLRQAVRRIRFLWCGMLRGNGETRGDHPTQKPVAVMRWCISQLPADAKTVLDPFMGSGTTGVACAGTGRRFIGIERESKYFDAACKRIDDAYRQPRLFKDEPPKMKQEPLL